MLNLGSWLKKLYLRINDRNKLNAVKKILFEHKGNTPVYVYFNDTKTNTIANKDMWVILSSTLIDRLKGILGEDNVVVV